MLVRAVGSRLTRVDGRTRDASSPSDPKAFAAIVSTPSCRVTDVRLPQLLRALSPMVLTLAGTSIDSMPESLKASVGSSVMPAGSVTDLAMQRLKELSPSSVTESPSSTLSRPDTPQNAQPAILVVAAGVEKDLLAGA